MNALLERFHRQRHVQREFDGELLVEEFLGPARCSVCCQPKIVVNTAAVPQREDDKICDGCKSEVAAYASRYSLPIHRALYELRNLHNDVRGGRATEVRA